MEKQKLYEIIKIVATAIISIATVLFVQSCVFTRNIVKNSQDVDIKSGAEQKQSADSASINFKDMLKNEIPL